MMMDERRRKERKWNAEEHGEILRVLHVLRDPHPFFSLKNLSIQFGDVNGLFGLARQAQVGQSGGLWHDVLSHGRLPRPNTIAERDF